MLLSGCASIKDDAKLDIVDRTPKIAGYHYRCDDMIKTVNMLRRCGKPQALAILRKYSLTHSNDLYQADRVALICFLLFKNSRMWGNTRFGAPAPDINVNIASTNYPLFPLALSDGVPFLLVNGYIVGGGIGGSARERSLAFITQCEDLPMISEDLPTRGYRRAAEDLISSPQFRNLYANTNEIPFDMILHQAETGPRYN